jgi:DNA (cytosine-5)-methyltransferase 1
VTVYDHVAGRLSALDRQVVAAVPPGGNWRDLPADFPSARVEQIRRSAAAGEGSRSTYYGRLHPDRPAYTVSTYFNRPGNGCFIHPVADRLLTVREAARLQGFPDSFRFSGRGRSRFVQVGNAVPPLLAYHLARVVPGETTVDLFSGAGGLALGFAWAGFKTLAAVDSDEAAIATFDRNLGNETATMSTDLSEPNQASRVLREIKLRAGADGIDVLVGGPPCQGFSTAGKWLTRDERNDLVFAFVAAAERLKPRRVVMENVAALLWRRGRPFLESVRRRLHVDGYRTAVALLHAETFGLPQLRRRLILLASRDGDLLWPGPTHAVSAPAYPEHQPGLKNGVERPHARGVLDAIGDLPLAAADDPDAPVPYATDARTPYQRWARGDLTVDELLLQPDPVPAEPQLTLEELLP